MKKFLSFIIAVALCVISVFGTRMISDANDDPTVSSSENVEGDSENMIPLSYLYVESPYLNSTAEQNVVISLGDGTENYSNVVLVYENAEGKQTEWNYTSREGELYLFSKVFGVDEAGVYHFVTLRVTEDGAEQAVCLEDLGIDARFGVDEGYEGYEPYVEDDEEETSELVDMSVIVLNDENVDDTEELVEDTLADVADDTLGQSAARSGSRAGASKNYVVAIDPGHGGSDSGAVNSTYGVKEKDLVLKIAKYAKAELEKYSGVEVYMTRETDVYLGIKERVDLAAAAGADILVSMHLNALNTSAYGAEVYYANTNLNASIGNEGQALASKVQSEIVKLGLYNRGIKVRTCVEDRYPDGSLQDYYGIIRYSKLAGFPGIIIEHAFIDNNSDYTKYLNTDAKLKALGVADATGIANYLNLSTGPVINIENLNEFVGKATIKVSGLGTNAKVVVKNGSLSKEYAVSSGKADIDFTIADFNSTRGTYTVEAYNSGGTSLLSQTFTVSDAAINVQVRNYNTTAKTFEVVVSGINLSASVSKVQVPVWTTSNQSDIKWYTAVKQSDGSYVATVNVNKHSGSDYKIHVYVTPTGGSMQYAGAIEKTISAADYLSLIGVSKGVDK